MQYRKPPDYDEFDSQQWKMNAQEAQNEASLRSERILKRVKTYIERFGGDENSILLKIINDIQFSAYFAKEPRRTGYNERLAADWLSATPRIIDFRTLP